MDNRLYTYSMVKTLYDKGKDYIDSFWPFVLNVIPLNKSLVPIDNIQNQVRVKYGLDIPQHSLTAIITRAKRKGYVVQMERKYSITDTGIKYLAMLETEQQISRRVNELLGDAQRFLEQKHHLTFSPDEIRELIQAFVREHMEFLEQFVVSQDTSVTERTSPKMTRRDEAALLDYFTEVERAKPTIFETLRDIICGSIISAITCAQSLADPTKKLQNTKAYFDTNFVFSILGLHFDEFNQPAKELLKLMKASGAFDFKVFDYTVDEIVRVLRNYAEEQHMYVPNIKVGSIFSSLKSKGWSAGDMREFIVKLEDKLAELGIDLEYTNTDLPTYHPTNIQDRSNLAKYKPRQPELGQNHDLAAIENIIQIRKRPVRLIENAKAFFLTSDIRLSRYDFLERGHKVRATICEVIPDRLLTNILWLKNPTLIKEIPLNSIISMHSRELFIDREVWYRFYTIVHDLNKKGTIDEKDISILLYDAHIDEVLRTYTQEDASRIESAWVLNRIEDAKKRLDIERSLELKKKIAEQKLTFEQRLSETQRVNEERFFNAFSEAKQRITTDARNEARLWVRLSTLGAIALIIVVLTLTLPFLLQKWGLVEPVAWVTTVILWILLPVLGIKLDPWQIRAKFKEWIFNRIYARRLRNSRLEELSAKIREGSSK